MRTLASVSRRHVKSVSVTRTANLPSSDDRLAPGDQLPGGIDGPPDRKPGRPRGLLPQCSSCAVLAAHGGAAELDPQLDHLDRLKFSVIGPRFHGVAVQLFPLQRSWPWMEFASGWRHGD